MKLYLEIEKYLKGQDINSKRIDNTNNLVIFKSKGKYHYLILDLYGVKKEWIEERSYFKLCIKKVKDFNQAKKEITNYLNLE